MKCYLSDAGVDQEGNFMEEIGQPREQQAQLFEGWGESIRAGFQHVNRQVWHNSGGDNHADLGQHSGQNSGQHSGSNGIEEDIGTRSSSKDSAATSRRKKSKEAKIVPACEQQEPNETQSCKAKGESHQVVAVQQPPGVVEVNSAVPTQEGRVARVGKAEEHAEPEEDLLDSQEPESAPTSPRETGGDNAHRKGKQSDSKSVRTVLGHANLTQARRLFNGPGVSTADGFNTSVFHRFIIYIVTHSWFDSLVCIFIIANALSIGILTNYLATHSTDGKVPTHFRVIDGFFCIFFTMEICFKIYAYRSSFFMGPSWGWNMFDVAVVGLQLVEEIGMIMVDGDKDVVPGANFSFVRTLRILRLIRILRLVRILRLISELRLLVMSILGSMRSLLWTVALLILLIYTISLYITQLVADYRNGANQTNIIDEHTQDLAKYYGSVVKTMISMFQAISGGIDWQDLMTPLKERISFFTAMVFLVYIAFSLLAMLNVVTGVFVESVMKSTVKDRNLFMISNARELFASIQRDDNSQGPVAMTWDVFHSKMHTSQMQEFFKAIDVDPCEAKGLFHLLDLDGSGSLSADEFLNGCLRLRGEAKSLDVALLIQEVRRVRKLFESHLEKSSRSMRPSGSAPYG